MMDMKEVMDSFAKQCKPEDLSAIKKEAQEILKGFVERNVPFAIGVEAMLIVLSLSKKAVEKK